VVKEGLKLQDAPQDGVRVPHRGGLLLEDIHRREKPLPTERPRLVLGQVEEPHL
jgi:hypothetical protein